MNKSFLKQLKVLLLFIVICTAFVFSTSYTTDKGASKAVLNYYKTNLDYLEAIIILFEKESRAGDHERLKQLFVSAREQYKKIEFIVEYHYPASAKKLNGPALPESEPSEPNEPQHPTGFQVLEETVYAELNEETRREITFELSNISNRVQRLKALLPELEINESNIIDAVKLNLYRLITKGITGFDSPVTLNSIAEAKYSLQSTQAVLSSFTGTEEVVDAIDEAKAFIKPATSFNEFNRAVFIEKYINRVCKLLALYQTKHNIPFIKENRAIAATATTLFDEGIFNPLFYAPSGTVAATAEQIALGKKLFGDPLLSANGKRSCKTCHIPEKAFTDGLALNEALTGNTRLLRNTPSLINVALQPVLFYDSHIAFLEDQAHDVILNRQEMGGLFENITKQLRKNKHYKTAFATHYPGSNITPLNVKTALAAYVRSLAKINSRFDEYMRGNKTSMTADELQGFNLFMGKAKCGTCHFMPLFSGVVPPQFDVMESEVLGIPANTDTLHSIQDLDSGKYNLYKIPHQLYSFKTTGLRNVALTAPYMHNGVYKTLDEVIEFYNRGGGAGLGFNLPHQTLPTNKLHLSVLEKKQIVAFLSTLGSQ